MAPRIGQVPTTKTAQTQAATTHIAKQQKTSNAKNGCMGLITQTLTQTSFKLYHYLFNKLLYRLLKYSTPPTINAIKINLNERRKCSALVEALLDDTMNRHQISGLSLCVLRL
ncbi:hypothetical protein TNCV_2773291 [Trichonephila clavipes]|nr:hypothetical protein TNCV_2773291 [Trichonephila clavipes]